MAYFSGTVHNVTFNNEGNGYYILRMRLDEEKSDVEEIGDTTPFGGEDLYKLDFAEPLVSVVGHISGLEVATGTWFGFEAKWVRDPKWGRQLKISRAPVMRGDWTPEVVTAMLPCRTISQSLAKLLHKHFGDQLIPALEDLETLESCPGLNQRTAGFVYDRWLAIVAVYKSIDFLHELELPKSAINRIWAYFGDDAQTILSENPWELVKIDGISFQKADQVAEKLNLDMDSPLRSKGAVLQTAKLLRNSGSLFMTTGWLKSQVGSIAADLDTPALVEGVKLAVQDGSLISDREFRSSPALYEEWFYNLENQSGALLAQRLQTAHLEERHVEGVLNTSPRSKAYYDEHMGEFEANNEGISHKSQTIGFQRKKIVKEAFKEAIHEWEEMGGFTLGDEQVQGIMNALTEPVSVITGLPGTGKTTSVRALVNILQEAFVSILLLSPTGIAAKRLSSVTGASAYTIHKAFAAGNISTEDQTTGYVGVIESRGGANKDGSEQTWDHSAANPHYADVVLVDESSMIDQHLLFKILECTSPTCRVVFVGDSAQLPSVGPGNVLKQMVDSGLFPVTSLSKIYRQEGTSDIVYASHDINNGKVSPFIFGRQSKDFMFLEVEHEEKVLEAVLKLVDKMYENRQKFQVLSPRHKDMLGVTNLNQLIRRRLNPAREGRVEAKIGSWTLRENDRVMVTKNNYQKGICNGDTGKIQRIDLKQKFVTVKIHGSTDQEVDLKFTEVLSHLRLAYCVTIHKMQGLESDVIIMPFVRGFRNQLQRNLLYTAVTRARKRVFMVGHRGAYEMAVDNDRIDQRNTLLKERIRKCKMDPEFTAQVLEPLYQSSHGTEGGDYELDDGLASLRAKMDQKEAANNAEQS